MNNGRKVLLAMAAFILGAIVVLVALYVHLMSGIGG